jgi:hypothetical protein
MTEEQIEYSINNGELKLNNWDKFTHYGIVGFLLIIPVMFVFFHTRDFIQGTHRQLKEGEIWFMIVPSLLSFLFYRLQKERLKFESIETNLTREKLDLIIEKVAIKFEWHKYIDNEKVVVAKTFPSFFSGSWGEQITILFDKNKILVNSICDPDKSSSVVSMGRNKKHIKTLVEEIKKASQ